ncbi:MAG: 6-aminohexanoate hydrolase [Deltaproteobacteria bacterium]|nr:6-aminohexanoate hydrolase [Deltaproteobacteria bacterium]
MTKLIFTISLSLFVFSETGIASQVTDRPETLTLTNFQFGPQNRWAFSHMREVLPTAKIEKNNKQVLTLHRGPDYVDDLTISFDGQERSIDEIAKSQYIDGLLVLKGGQIVFEKYFGYLDESKPHLMNSVSKSIVSLVAAKLAEEKLIDLAKPVSYYVPELAKSGWGQDSLQVVLDMRDGSDYTELYPDFTTTFRLQDCAIGWTEADYCPENGPQGLHDFLSTIGRDESKAGKFSYRSGSTNVIGWVLESATGKPLAELISTYVWQPMGAEFDADITVDIGGSALADHGMSSTLRDLGRVGLLVLNDGSAFGNQVIPAEFIADLHAEPEAGNQIATEGVALDYTPYYRSFWWGDGNTERDLTGLGIHGQILRVAPEAGIVVVILSTWPRADGDGEKELWFPTLGLVGGLVEQFR